MFHPEFGDVQMQYMLPTNWDGAPKRAFENLVTLSRYLQEKGLARNRFSMEDYGGTFWDHEKRPSHVVRCPLGWAVYAKIALQDSQAKSWVGYWEENFSIPSIEGGTRDSFDWCFSHRWAVTDNSVDGAIHRMEVVLNLGIPEDAYERSTCRDPVRAYDFGVSMLAPTTPAYREKLLRQKPGLARYFKWPD